MELLRSLAQNLWLNHRKKAVAFLLGLMFAGIAAVSGIPLTEIKDAAKEAADKPTVEAPVAPAPVAPAPVAPVGPVVAPKADLKAVPAPKK